MGDGDQGATSLVPQRLRNGYMRAARRAGN